MNRRSSLKGDVKKQTPHVDTEAFFSSIGFFGWVWNSDDSHSHNTEMEVSAASPQLSQRTTGMRHRACSLGGLKRALGWQSCEHMNYRGLTAHLAVVKRLVFNCAFMRVTRVANHVVPPVLLHSLLSAVTSNSKLLNVRGEPLHFLSKKICPSYRKTNSIALQGYINWVTESLWRTEALLTHIHGAMCLLNEISTRK